MALTTEQRRRTLDALTETCRLLEKEISYQEQFQKADYIASLRAHITKLESMLSE